jgi:hypothetical protein
LLLPTLSRAKNMAARSKCLSNLHQIGIGTGLYLGDNDDRMPWVDDVYLQFTPPVNAAGKRYACMGSFMPLYHPYVPDPRIWISPPVGLRRTNVWLKFFQGPWRENGFEDSQKGTANYISDKLAELDPEQPRFLRGRTPLSCAVKRGTSVSQEEWLMSPFFDREWHSDFAEQWSVGESKPPPTGWTAHMGGRNQLYLDLHADWIRRDRR